MFEQYGLYLAIIGALVIAALAAYAGKLLVQLKHQNQQQEHAQQLAQKALREHDTKVLSSVNIIVKAMLEQQCEVSEGSWRVSVLLDSLKTSHDLAQEFPAMYELYQAIKHMPIMEERKKLTKQERMKFDLERMKIESKLTDNINQELPLLKQYVTERLTVLST